MPSRNKQGVIAKEQRLRRIEDMMLRGITSQHQIAAAFAITQPQACYDVNEVYRRWAKDDKRVNLRRKRRKAVRIMESLLQEARNAFDRSRMDAEEVHYRERMEQCIACSGTGMDKKSEEDWCETCEGEGTVRIGVTTTVRKGQAGDPTFLRVAQYCVSEIARIDGLVKPPAHRLPRSVLHGEVIHTHLSMGQNDYLSMPMDEIIRAKVTLERLCLEVKKREGNNGKVVDGKVIEGNGAEQKGQTNGTDTDQ